MNYANNNPNYVDYRCIEPNSVQTGNPWFPISNVCPCEPKLSNPTGRGYVACPFGVQTNTQQIHQLNMSKVVSVPKVAGAMFPEVSSNFSVISPPQFQPRPLTNIGYTWRSGM